MPVGVPQDAWSAPVRVISQTSRLLLTFFLFIEKDKKYADLLKTAHATLYIVTTQLGEVVRLDQELNGDHGTFVGEVPIQTFLSAQATRLMDTSMSLPSLPLNLTTFV